MAGAEQEVKASLGASALCDRARYAASRCSYVRFVRLDLQTSKSRAKPPRFPRSSSPNVSMTASVCEPSDVISVSGTPNLGGSSSGLPRAAEACEPAEPTCEACNETGTCFLMLFNLVCDSLFIAPAVCLRMHTQARISCRATESAPMGSPAPT